MTTPDPTPRPLDELRERCVEAAEEAVTSRHRNSVSGCCNPGCCFDYAYGARAADAVIPLVVEHIAAHFDQVGGGCERIAGEIRSTYGQ